jgi:hypothetical protein
MEPAVADAAPPLYATLEMRSWIQISSNLICESVARREGRSHDSDGVSKVLRNGEMVRPTSTAIVVLAQADTR